MAKSIVSIGKQTFTVETERSDSEIWYLEEKDYLNLVAYMIKELGKNWRRSKYVNGTARSWLYDNMIQPNKEFCGEGSGFSISKD